MMMLVKNWVYVMSSSMTHYIIATHGKLAKGFEDTVSLLTQKQDMHSITAYIDDEFPSNLTALMEGFSEADNVVVFTDLTCGSVTQKIMELYGYRDNLHIFAGVNLSLILEVMLSEQLPNEEYCNSVVESAKDQICYLHNVYETRE